MEGLYLCGAGTHPGGGVMGVTARNAASQILGDAGVTGLRGRARDVVERGRRFVARD